MNFSRLQAVYNSFGMKTIQVKTGQLLEIHETIGEGDNKRNWKFKCLVYGVKNASHPNGTFLVRGVTSGVIIEKIYPLCFEKFSKIILLDEFKVRRSKIYFLRDKVGKGARLKSIITSERRNMDLLTLQIQPIVEEKIEIPAVLVDESLETITIESVDADTTESTINE
jgi:large subunit ribosomal protein L19